MINFKLKVLILKLLLVLILCTTSYGLEGWDKWIKLDIDYTNKIGASVTGRRVIIKLQAGNGETTKVFDEIGENCQKMAITMADGDPLTYSAYILPTGATFDAETKIFDWTPTFKQSGVYNLVFKVEDANDSDFELVTFTVNNVKNRFRARK